MVANPIPIITGTATKPLIPNNTKLPANPINANANEAIAAAFSKVITSKTEDNPVANVPIL